MDKGFPGTQVLSGTTVVGLQTLTGVLYYHRPDNGGKGLDAGERLQNPLHEFSYCCGLNTRLCRS